MALLNTIKNFTGAYRREGQEPVSITQAEWEQLDNDNLKF